MESDYHLQMWEDEKRVLELTQNIRSGADVWYSQLLDECRRGELKIENYNFLHGFPARAKVEFWYHRRTEPDTWHLQKVCSIEHPCNDCKQEISRRNRLLDMDTDADAAAQRIAGPQFKTCVLITPFNKAVFQFSVHRALSFATSSGFQVFWMQAVDHPPAWYPGSMTQK